MEKNLSKIKLTSRQEDYSQWYLDVAKAWELYEYSPVPWCIVFMPKAVTIWEKTKDEINKKIQAMWVQNLYLPLLIPMSFFEKEKEHVEWFAPELAIVTIWWWKELEDKLAIRPTSETLFCEFFRDNLQSYRDLPLLYNQWANVLRWEKRTRPFLRTTEFYWQEWHTLHETKKEADEFSIDILHNVYAKIYKELLAIDWIEWQKSDSEKFAWAEKTATFESMMSNGWALQMCTSHLLWKWFMEQFWVSFLWRDWKQDYPAYTSWGFTTRSIWWMISSHSDDKWLIIPPRISEYKAVILPIYGKENEEKVNSYSESIAQSITWSKTKAPVKWEYFKKFVWESSQVLIDYRNVRLWEKITDFELSGYPIRIECGERDIESNSCVVASRITWEKIIIELKELNNTIGRMLTEWQDELFKRSRERLQNNVVPCYSIEEIWETIEQGKFAIYEWDKNPKFEEEIKEKFKATTRCIPYAGQFEVIDSFKLLKENTIKVIVARAF